MIKERRKKKHFLNGQKNKHEIDELLSQDEQKQYRKKLDKIRK